MPEKVLSHIVVEKSYQTGRPTNAKSSQYISICTKTVHTHTVHTHTALVVLKMNNVLVEYALFRNKIIMQHAL